MNLGKLSILDSVPWPVVTCNKVFSLRLDLHFFTFGIQIKMLQLGGITYQSTRIKEYR